MFVTDQQVVKGVGGKLFGICRVLCPLKADAIDMLKMFASSKSSFLVGAYVVAYFDLQCIMITGDNPLSGDRRPRHLYSI